jgi:glutamate carboxypeptidase
VTGVVLLALRASLPAMIDELAALVEVESPSTDVDVCGRCAAVVADIGATLLGRAPVTTVECGRPFLRWSFGAPTRVLLVGHLDTVWPMDTLEHWPFAVEDEPSIDGALKTERNGVSIYRLEVSACR